MIHKIKLFLYHYSFRILFKEYRNKWFDNQLQELIIETLEDLSPEFLETAFNESEKIYNESMLKRAKANPEFAKFWGIIITDKGEAK